VGGDDRSSGPEAKEGVPRRGVVGVIRQDGRWLMIRRAEGIRAGGWWCFPGGAIEPGESPADALVREIWEEVGLRVRPVRQVWVWRRPNGELELLWWLAELTQPVETLWCNPAEVAEARWVAPADVSALHPLLENNLTFLETIWPQLLADMNGPPGKAPGH